MFLGQGKWHLFHVHGKVRPTFDGNRRTKTIKGDREHKTANLRWGGGGGGRGTRPFISGEHGDIYPHHFGRASRMYRLLNTSKHNKYSIEDPGGSMLPGSLKIIHWSPQLPELPESIFPLLPKSLKLIQLLLKSPKI